MQTIKKLDSSQREELLTTLKDRFEQHINRHAGLTWAEVLAKLEASPEKLWSIYEMERTGGEPDVVAWRKDGDVITFYDCAKESPAGRRSLCYDQEALDKRKTAKPKDSALNMAKAMGIELLTEAQYQALQKLDELDLKTSSWLKTPAEIRNLGGAIFGDRRFNRVFIYHNGAESYYAARGFRGSLSV